jgi:hypothetical protein
VFSVLSLAGAVAGLVVASMVVVVYSSVLPQVGSSLAHLLTNL